MPQAPSPRRPAEQAPWMVSTSDLMQRLKRGTMFILPQTPISTTDLRCACDVPHAARASGRPVGKGMERATVSNVKPLVTCARESGA
jgi:hypothetical protein